MKLNKETTAKRLTDNTKISSGTTERCEQRELTSRASMARSGGLW